VTIYLDSGYSAIGTYTYDADSHLRSLHFDLLSHASGDGLEDDFLGELLRSSRYVGGRRARGKGKGKGGRWV
jgi:hypothetical protein